MPSEKVISDARAKMISGEPTFSVRNSLIVGGLSATVADSIVAELLPINRPLTFGEANILRIVEEEYGRQNLDQNLSFTPANGAELAIKTSDGRLATAICLTSFSLSMDQGSVDEQELRDDWIRDSRSRVNYHWISNPSLFRLGHRPGAAGDMVLTAGKRIVDFWGEQRCSKDSVEYVLYPNTMRKCAYPFHVDPITLSLREDLINIITKLHEVKVQENENANNKSLSLKVRVEWE